MRRCSFFGADEARCGRTVRDGQAYCYSHDPERAEERSRNAKRAGRSGGKGRPRRRPVEEELIDLKGQLQVIADSVLDGVVLQGQAAVAVQALNAKARALELERRWKEIGEVEEKLLELEHRLETPRGVS